MTTGGAGRRWLAAMFACALTLGSVAMPQAAGLRGTSLLGPGDGSVVLAPPASAVAAPQAPPLEGYVVRLDTQNAIVGPGTSVAPGERIGFAVSARAARNWSPRIIDSAGKTIIALPEAPVDHVVPPTASPWRDGSGYPVASWWQIPADLPSGVYSVARMPELFFAVRQKPAAQAAVIILLPTNTLNAYTRTENRSLYKLPIQAPEVSFLRPQRFETITEWMSFLKWEAVEKPFGRSVAFVTDADMDDAQALDHARVLIVLGHSEYWTRAARQAFDAFIARGGSAIMAGGNDMWWQARLGPGGRSLIAYKEAAEASATAGGDPVSDPLLKTTLWIKDELKAPPIGSIGGDYRHGGWNAKSKAPDPYDTAFVVAAPTSPLLEGTGAPLCGLIDTPFSAEYDGAPIAGLDASGRPVPDLAAIQAYRFQLLAFKWNVFKVHKLGTMHILQSAPHSGYVLHMGARNCCVSAAFYADSGHGSKSVQTVLRNAVRLFLSGADPISSASPPQPVAFALQTPHKGPLPLTPQGPCAPHVEEEGSGGPSEAE